jgi:hypothetical protein
MDKPVLSPSLLSTLAESNPLGAPVEPSVVQAWFDMVWPRFQTYRYTQRGFPRAVASWWQRIRPGELQAARARALALEEEAVDARMTALAREANSVDPRPSRSRQHSFGFAGTRAHG